MNSKMGKPKMCTWVSTKRQKHENKSTKCLLRLGSLESDSTKDEQGLNLDDLLQKFVFSTVSSESSTQKFGSTSRHFVRESIMEKVEENMQPTSETMRSYLDC